MVRKRVLYSGSVQGVGFRWTAVQSARALDVTGQVRNLPDGRVELIAEGPPDQVSALLAALADRMSGMIRGTDVRDEPATGQFRSFGVAR